LPVNQLKHILGDLDLTHQSVRLYILEDAEGGQVFNLVEVLPHTRQSHE